MDWPKGVSFESCIDPEPDIQPGYSEPPLEPSAGGADVRAAPVPLLRASWRQVPLPCLMGDFGCTGADGSTGDRAAQCFFVWAVLYVRGGGVRSDPQQELALEASGLGVASRNRCRYCTVWTT